MVSREKRDEPMQHESIPHESDIDLMLLVREDDDITFSTLYLRYHGRISNFCFGLSRNRAASSDMAQEVFLRIWKFRHRYSNTGSFAAYVFGFARNIWLEHCRAKQKQFKIELLGALGNESDRFMATRLPEPDSAAGHAEIHEHIFEALDTLPEEQRMVFVLRSIEGLSLDEVASVMQCPVNTVRSRQIIALKKLRRLLGRTYGHEVRMR